MYIISILLSDKPLLELPNEMINEIISFFPIAKYRSFFLHPNGRMNRIFSLSVCNGFQELRTISIYRDRCGLKRLVWDRCISQFAGCLSSSTWFGLFISHMYMDLVMIMVLVS